MAAREELSEMEGNMEPTTLAAQQAAIGEARARYERGEITFEAFRRALDALALARDTDECQVILHALPSSPLASLSALESPPPAPRAPAAPADHKRFIAFMSQTKKMRRSWRLRPNTQAVAFMGEVKLDLGMAELPPHAHISVTAIMGTVILYVPSKVRVSVRSTVLLGDANALGEHANGVVAFGHEEHAPTPEAAIAELEIEVFVLMGNVQVVLTDGPVVSIGEMVRDALQAAATSFRRGWVQGATPPASISAGADGHPQRTQLPGPTETPRGYPW